MFAYLLLLVAVLTRVLPHAGWMNFTAVGGALLYFGARRPWREMVAPLAVLMSTDFYLTTFSYGYSFRWQQYVITWAWYAAAMLLGAVLLGSRTTWLRLGVGAVLGPTSFFVVSNYAVWAAGGMYPYTPAGLASCYAAGIPFYRNDVLSTTIVLALAFGVPVLVRRMQLHDAQALAAGK